MALGPGRVVAGRFRLERIAGEGGMGVVYRATDLETGGTVALKLLRRQSVEDARRFAQEAQILVASPDPALVRLVHHGIAEDGRLFLAMEWLEGEDLALRLGRTGLLTEESIAIAQRVADALAVAHAGGVVHRDVKPSNVFLCGKDPRKAKLLDFGIARIRGRSRHTQTGMILGTPGYMAPEQARGASDLDARADVFALGCVLYECLAGRVAFSGEHPIAILGKILLEEPESLAELRPGVLAELDDLVRRLMAKRREDRPADGAAVARELAALASVSDSRPSSTVPRPPAITGREQRLVSIVLVGSSGDPSLDPTLPSRPEPDPHAPLREVAARYGARLDALADGSSLVTLHATWNEHAHTGGTTASDQVVLAARCALALHRAVALPMVLCTGVSDMSGRFPVGDAIDRAAALLAPARAPGSPASEAHDGGIPIDSVTAGLLERRFDVARDGSPARLLGERTVEDAPRTLLGRATPFVGRERELAVIQGLFEECLDEPVARAVVVTGPAGIGKSRLCQELLPRLAAAEPVAPWRAHGDPMGAGSPLAMLAQALAGAVGIHAADPLAVRRAAVQGFVAARLSSGDTGKHPTTVGSTRRGTADVDRVAAFIGEIVDSPFPDEAAPGLRAARADAVLMGDQTRRAFEDLLAAETASRAVVIVLEDLQWSDVSTIAHIDAILRNLRDRPIFVLALARPEVHEAFPRLWADRRFEELRLAEVGKRASARLVRSVLTDLDDDRVARIVDGAGGNAFFLEELIRAEATRGSGEPPGSVLAIVQARLESLPADARRVLRAASVFGQRFWRGGLAALLGDCWKSLEGDASRAPEMAMLATLVSAELVSPRGEGAFAGQEEYGFRHALVREAAYATLTPADRQLAHRLAGSWLERAGEKDPLVLAEHAERGGERERAVRWYRAAAEAALEATDLAGAIACSARGIACGATGEVRGALRRLQARALALRGQLREMIEPAAEAMQLLPEGSPPWLQAAAEHAVSQGHLGNPRPAEELGSFLVSHRPDASTFSTWIDAAARMATQLMYVRLSAGVEALFTAIEAARSEHGQALPGSESRRLGALASREKLVGDQGRYLSLWRAAVELADREGDFRKGSMMRTNLGNALVELGCFEEAEVVLREVMAPATRLGLAGATANAQSNLGMVLASRGRIAEALEVERRAVEAYRGIGIVRLLGGSKMYLARILTMLDRLDESECEAREAAELLEVSPAVRPTAWSALAECLLRAGRAAEALEAARRACDEIAALGAVEEGDAFAHLVLAEALEATGDAAAAREAIRFARDRLLACAGRIGDPALRASFLENVADNARTIALAAAWLGG